MNRSVRAPMTGAVLVLLLGCSTPESEEGVDASSGDGSGETIHAPSEVDGVGDSEIETALTPRERDGRGDEHLFAGRFDEAIADYDAFLDGEPEFDPQHWRRGIAYYYAGRYADGAAQFVRHRTVNPNDVENAAWHFLCMARAATVDEARTSLLPVGPDQRDPMMEIYELFAGRATTQDVLEVATSSPQRDAVFFAHLYLGLYYEALGDTPKAREHIELSATTHGRSHYMGRVARVHASLLKE